MKRWIASLSHWVYRRGYIIENILYWVYPREYITPGISYRVYHTIVCICKYFDKPKIIVLSRWKAKVWKALLPAWSPTDFPLVPQICIDSVQCHILTSVEVKSGDISHFALFSGPTLSIYISSQVICWLNEMSGRAQVSCPLLPSLHSTTSWITSLRQYQDQDRHPLTAASTEISLEMRKTFARKN